jgi:multiple sugar transport system substrate-binding protein
MFFSITASSENQRESAKFVNFFLTDLEVNDILLAERGVPIIPKVRDSLKAKVDPTSQLVFEFIDLVGNGNASPIDPPDPAETGEILKLFRDTTLSVLLEKMTPQQGAQTIMQQANAILAR